MQHQDILILVHNSIDEINRQLKTDDRLEKSMDTILLGEGGTLDSLGLIGFIVTFEEALEQAYGVRHNLLGEEFVNNPNGPLQSVKSLVDFIYAQRQRG